MRKVFIDIGGYNGVSAEFFRNNHPEGKDFEIYTFECDERNIAILKNRPELNINLIEKAAWIYDGEVKYYYGVSDGGTLYPSKSTGNINPSVFVWVPTIDLARFILSNFNDEDYIVIKMNCEGSEYELIPHLKKYGLINWVDKWYIQWHYQKIGLSEAEHNRISDIIPKWWPWNCQLYAEDFKEVFKQSL